MIDLDENDAPYDLPVAEERCQAFTLWLRAGRTFGNHVESAKAMIEQVLDENPHTTLQVLLEPGDPSSIATSFLAELRRTCYRRTTYLDRFYSILPGPMKGSKRLVVLLDASDRDLLGTDEIAAWGEFAAIVWRGLAEDEASELGECEFPDGRGLNSFRERDGTEKSMTEK